MSIKCTIAFIPARGRKMSASVSADKNTAERPSVRARTLCPRRIAKKQGPNEVNPLAVTHLNSAPQCASPLRTPHRSQSKCAAQVAAVCGLGAGILGDPRSRALLGPGQACQVRLEFPCN